MTWFTYNVIYGTPFVTFERRYASANRKLGPTKAFSPRNIIGLREKLDIPFSWETASNGGAVRRWFPSTSSLSKLKVSKWHFIESDFL